MLQLRHDLEVWWFRLFCINNITDSRYYILGNYATNIFLNLNNVEIENSGDDSRSSTSAPEPPPPPLAPLELLTAECERRTTRLFLLNENSMGLRSIILQRLLSRIIGNAEDHHHQRRRRRVCRRRNKRIQWTPSSGSERLNDNVYPRRHSRHRLRFSDDEEELEPPRRRQRISWPPPPPLPSPQPGTSRGNPGLGLHRLRIIGDDDDDDDVNESGYNADDEEGHDSGSSSMVEPLHSADELEVQKSPSTMCASCTHPTDTAMPRSSSSSSWASLASTVILSKYDNDNNEENESQNNYDDFPYYPIINVDYNSDSEHSSSSSTEDELL